jgi:hypothetical protein
LFKRFGIAWICTRIVLTLALSVVAAVGIAWGFAAWEQRKEGVYRDPHRSGIWARESLVNHTDNPVASLVHLFVRAPMARHDYSKLGTSLTEFDAGTFSPSESRGWTFGWPVRCLRFSEEGPSPYLRSKFEPVRTSTWINGWRLEPAAGTTVILPIRPLWPGMAVQLAIWGSILGWLLLGRRLWMNVVRKKRGQCGACGYDLRSLGPGVACPECGPGH